MSDSVEWRSNNYIIRKKMILCISEALSHAEDAENIGRNLKEHSGGVADTNPSILPSLFGGGAGVWTGSHDIAWATSSALFFFFFWDEGLTMLQSWIPRLKGFSYLSLQGSGITSMHHHAWLVTFLPSEFNTYIKSSLGICLICSRIPMDSKIHGCSSLLFKTTKYLHRTCIHPPEGFTVSPDDW
jgi:hypothetical protein